MCKRDRKSGLLIIIDLCNMENDVLESRPADKLQLIWILGSSSRVTNRFTHVSMNMRSASEYDLDVSINFGPAVFGINLNLSGPMMRSLQDGSKQISCIMVFEQKG